jgi:hypothetical protein
MAKYVHLAVSILLLLGSASVAQSPSENPKPSDPCPAFHHQNIPDAQWDFYPSLGILSAPSNSGTDLEMKDWKKSADCVKEWVAKTCPYPRCSRGGLAKLIITEEGTHEPLPFISATLSPLGLN